MPGYVYIDGQNVGTGAVGPIIEKLRELGIARTKKYFYVSEDQRSSFSGEKLGLFEDAGIELLGVYCVTGKNSVDIRIAVDAIENG